VGVHLRANGEKQQLISITLLSSKISITLPPYIVELRVLIWESS